MPCHQKEARGLGYSQVAQAYRGEVERQRCLGGAKSPEAPFAFIQSNRASLPKSHRKTRGFIDGQRLPSRPSRHLGEGEQTKNDSVMGLGEILWGNRGDQEIT
ncbi:hypothetical protein T265_04672 [Opisthorchis viverrini]|uniref:Uncharacterized protein n=1 Tax=Opisthorchis viverrini TaxID=6198 RepID=A0A075AG99_OPIVI|nr:hypothetical protein T265_04672 [Opisthorchis viverrini]KER28539.1 hypothetical protein T265_04672 [Opisthorchis viverrini]